MSLLGARGEGRARRLPAIRVSRGFTLVELLVVTAILIIITGLVLANHTRFGGKILLENLAYDMALSVRQAQVYGISVRRFGTNNYLVGYGMHFATSEPSSYELFADGDQDSLLSANETVQTYNLERGYRIEKLCAPAGSDISSCTSVSQLDVLFKRPEPDAWISIDGLACLTWSGATSEYVPVPGRCQESARIGLSSPAGDRTDFVIDLNGQVAVNH